MTVVVGILLVLLAWTVALGLLAFGMRLQRAYAARRRAADERVWRVLVDALVLDGTPLPRVPQRQRDVVLDLLLRYRAVLRGHEAARITDHLELLGYVRSAVEGLRSSNHWRRATSAALLGRMRSEEAVAALIDAMHDADEDVRMVAARSLAAIGDPAAVGALTEALADPSRWTATTVAADLVEMGPAAVPSLLEIAAAADSGRPGAHEAGVTAVRVLGEIRDPRAERVLIDLLAGARDLNVRARCAAALGAVGGPQAPPALREALRDEAWQVRAQAATSLGALGDRGAVDALTAAIEDGHWWVRRNCAEALSRLGHPGRRALVALAESKDRYVRDRCRAVLEEMDLPERGGEAPARTGRPPSRPESGALAGDARLVGGEAPA